MAHEEVFYPPGLGTLQEMFLGHDGERTDMRTLQLGIVIVMMVMRAAPDAAGAQDQDAEDMHQTFRQPGLGQNRVMLLVVIDDKKTEDQQPSHYAAHDPAGQVEIPDCSREEK